MSHITGNVYTSLQKVWDHYEIKQLYDSQNGFGDGDLKIIYGGNGDTTVGIYSSTSSTFVPIVSDVYYTQGGTQLGENYISDRTN